jgi:hypothetical protein
LFFKTIFICPCISHRNINNRKTAPATKQQQQQQQKSNINNSNTTTATGDEISVLV